MTKHEKTIRTICLSSAGYVIIILTWFILWITSGDKNWWMTVLNRIVPYLFLPTPIFMIYLFVLRQYKWALQFFVPISIFFFLYSPYVLPDLGGTNKDPDLSVMTYNIRFNNYDFNVVAQIILTYKPDFVSLQEIQPAMMNELQKRLINVYPYSLMGNEHPFGTTAILSRHPVLDAYILDLQTDRPAVVLKSEINGTKITVISAHLLAYGLQWVKIQDMPKAIMERTTNQNQQAQRIVEEIQNQDGIVILGCDCLRAPNKIKICSISITSFFEAI